MRRKFVTNLVFMMGANLLIKPFWILGIDRNVQNMLGSHEYGVYYNLSALSLLLYVILDFGIANYATTQVARHPENINENFTSLFTLKALLSLVYLLVSFATGYVIIGYTRIELYMLAFVLFNQVLLSFHYFFRSHISGLQHFKTDSILSILDRALMIAFCAFLMWGGMLKLSIYNFIYAQTLSLALCSLVSFLVLRPYLGSIRLHINRKALAAMYSKTAPFALLALLMMAYTRIDNLMLQRLLPDGYYQEGIYAQGFRLLDAANMMAALVAMLLLPIFSKMLKEKADINPLVETSLGILVAPAIVFASACYWYRQPLIELLYTATNPASADMFGYLMLCFVPLSAMYVFGTLLTAHSSMKTLNILAAIALGLNVILNLWLIPLYQAKGAAIAALATQAFIGLSNTWFAYREIVGKPVMKTWLKLLLLTALVNLGYHYSTEWFSNWVTGMLMLSAAGMLALFVLRLINIKQALLLLKR